MIMNPYLSLAARDLINRNDFIAIIMPMGGCDRVVLQTQGLEQALCVTIRGQDDEGTARGCHVILQFSGKPSEDAGPAPGHIETALGSPAIERRIKEDKFEMNLPNTLKEIAQTYVDFIFKMIQECIEPGVPDCFRIEVARDDLHPAPGGEDGADSRTAAEIQDERHPVPTHLRMRCPLQCTNKKFTGPEQDRIEHFGKQDERYAIDLFQDQAAVAAVKQAVPKHEPAPDDLPAKT